jgi:hypothetical protein
MNSERRTDTDHSLLTIMGDTFQFRPMKRTTRGSGSARNERKTGSERALRQKKT